MIGVGVSIGRIILVEMAISVAVKAGDGKLVTSGVGVRVGSKMGVKYS